MHFFCPANIFSGSDGSVTIWNTVGAKKVESVIQPGNEINAVDYCSDGTCYATAGKVEKNYKRRNF